MTKDHASHNKKNAAYRREVSHWTNKVVEAEKAGLIIVPSVQEAAAPAESTP